MRGPGRRWRPGSDELRDALAIAGQHLSLYQLTIEPETPFAALHAAGKLVIPDEDAALALYEATQEMTGAAGLPAYEISNHAAPGEESRHNLALLALWRVRRLRAGRARAPGRRRRAARDQHRAQPGALGRAGRGRTATGSSRRRR